MQGHVYLDATQLEGEEQTRIAVDCDLEDVGEFDKFKLVEGLCKALQISKQDLMFFALPLDREV